MKAKVKLPRNVQFIYEHSLAREELEKGFGVRNISWNTDEPWTFNVDLNGQKNEIIRKAAYAGDIDGVNSIYTQLIKPAYQGGFYNRTRSVNQYLTHWIYPYKGKFHPQMIRALLNIVGAKPGWNMFEPFSGSGTAALEGQLLGINVSAIDISPLCVLLTNVKTNSWKYADEIEAIAQNIFMENTSLNDFVVNKKYPDEIRNFFSIAKMVTLSDEANRGRDIKKMFPQNIKLMLESIKSMAHAKKTFNLELGFVNCWLDDIRYYSKELSEIKADLIITSPPYSIALDYVKNDKHALSALGLDIKKIRDNFIGVAGRGLDDRLRRYEKDMKLSLATMSKVLKSGASCIVVIGNVTVEKEEKYTTEDFSKWASDVDLKLYRELPKIVFGLYNVMADEKILFFRKE